MIKKKDSSRIGSLKHEQASRKNIPTEENRNFAEEESVKQKLHRLELDPSLDPQLRWTGKGERDSLEVEAPMIYKQEHIAPQHIIEDFRRHAQKEHPKEQQQDSLKLFEQDFDGLGRAEKLQFYQHDHSWQNRMIFGDSLEVMSSLLEREGMKESVQCVYIDPPYGIKFGSNWQVSTRKKEVKDSYKDVTTEPEAIRAFRDTWNLGVHSYLDYWRDRFIVARELLKESGSIFVQIGDKNIHLLRCLLDEVFGSENYVVIIPFRKTTTTPMGNSVNDYIIWYAKDREKVKMRDIYLRKTDSKEKPDDPMFSLLCSRDEEIVMPKNKEHAEELLELGWRWCRTRTLSGLTSQYPSKTRSGIYSFRGKDYPPKQNRHWSYDPEGGMKRLEKADRLIQPKTEKHPISIIFWDDVPRKRLTNFWDDLGGVMNSIYVVQTSTKPIERCLLMTSDPGDLVLDPTCGSGTTAFVAEKWGRRWITCDTSRVALALARTRLMNALYPHYRLENPSDITQGFQYKRVPHITLKDIANNEDIDAIWDRYEQQLQPLRQKLGHEEDWQVPREQVPREAAAANPTLQRYNELRRERQAAIDASISAKAQSETLYDQPLEDKSCLRVAGPFTVESLSAPLPAFSTTTTKPSATATSSDQTHEQYIKNLIEQLQKAGVENSRKEFRIIFTRPIERYSNALLSAVGHYQANGEEKRAAICFGPQYGMVNNDLIYKAALEAKEGFRHDILIVCGAAFAPDLWQKAKGYQQYGSLRVLLAKMHPDVFNPKQPLKSKQGQSHNLFMVFGEPEIEDDIDEDGNVTITIKGIDVYDPNINTTRSHNTSEIACWFIDTDHASDCFFVRQAYFLGEDSRPYKNLQKALKAEISEQAWLSHCGIKSRPFPRPKSGKIAVKVINHYGDEVTKTFDFHAPR